MIATADFAAVFAGLYAAHQVGDHWVQTDRAATRKGEPGWIGRAACAWHVATYTLTAMAALGALMLATDLALNAWAMTVGLVVSAVSHYVADRRTPLMRLAKATGHGKFIEASTAGVSGPYLMDQSWHIGWLFISALIIAAGA